MENDILAIHNMGPRSNGRLKIASDYDGVHVRLCDAVLQMLNWKYGTKHTADECDSWDWWEKFGFEKKDFWTAVKAIHNNHWEPLLKPYDESRFEVFPRLLRGHDTYILTAKRKKLHDSIRREFALWHHEEVPIAEPLNGAKWIDSGDKLKYDWDILIEDNGDLARAMMESQGGDPREVGGLILMAAPWNRMERNLLETTYAGCPTVAVAHSWDDVEGLVEEWGRVGSFAEHNKKTIDHRTTKEENHPCPYVK